MYLAILVEGDPKVPFSIRGVGEGATPFLGLLHFTIDLKLIMLSAKQGGIKYHFWVFGITRPGDWTPVSRTIGEHSTHGLGEKPDVSFFKNVASRTT